MVSVLNEILNEGEIVALPFQFSIVFVVLNLLILILI